MFAFPLSKVDEQEWRGLGDVCVYTFVGLDVQVCVRNACTYSCMIVYFVEFVFDYFVLFFVYMCVYIFCVNVCGRFYILVCRHKCLIVSVYAYTYAWTFMSTCSYIGVQNRRVRKPSKTDDTKRLNLKKQTLKIIQATLKSSGSP